jgi:Spx/MgsR family transcriptional regulator
MITLYGIKSCDSVKKALKFFKEHALEIDFVDFKQVQPSTDQLKKWADKNSLKTLFNNRSRTYKDLGLAKEDLSDDDKINWMHKEPLLVKRPVIEYNSSVIIGFDENNYKGVFNV